MEIGAYVRAVHRMSLGRRTVRQDDRFSARIVARDHAPRGLRHLRSPYIVSRVPGQYALPGGGGSGGGGFQRPLKFAHGFVAGKFAPLDARMIRVDTSPYRK